MRIGLKMLIFWLLVTPTTITLLHVFKDFILGNNIQLLSYFSVFLVFAAGGLVLGLPLNYLIFKLGSYKEKHE